ncbi:MAG: hypothetical protein JNJ58_04385 [Chitinophagaceae bacterium]|nr:hypothetical protein [Chitinophagaceae bacterium]
MMQNLQFPLQFKFKIATLSNDFVATDAGGTTLAYVRQKLLKFIDEINVYSNETRTEELYRINASKWIDFNTTYRFTNAQGQYIGCVARRGWASLWKAKYEVFDENDQADFVIQEENGWVKVLDGLMSEIPVVNIFTGYLFNPSYLVTRTDGTPIARLKKEASFFGRNFSVTALNMFQSGEETRIVLSLMMMILLERRRG